MLYLLSRFECDNHTVHMLTQWCLLLLLTSSSVCIPVHSPWLPGYINVVQTLLIILTMTGLFLDRPHKSDNDFSAHRFLFRFTGMWRVTSWLSWQLRALDRTHPGQEALPKPGQSLTVRATCPHSLRLGQFRHTSLPAHLWDMGGNHRTQRQFTQTWLRTRQLHTGSGEDLLDTYEHMTKTYSRPPLLPLTLARPLNIKC